MQGLIVKGKIELPKPPVKKEKEENEKEQPVIAKKKTYDRDKIITTQGPQSDRGNKPKNYKGKKYNKDYNPLEAARKKKEWEEKKKESLEVKKKKTARSKHYKANIQTLPASKTIKKKVIKQVVKKKEVKIEGNAFQKFWRWMNT